MSQIPTDAHEVGELEGVGCSTAGALGPDLHMVVMEAEVEEEEAAND